MRMLFAALTIAVLAACAGDVDDDIRFSDSGVVLRVPSTWSVTGFSVGVTPPRLVAASYDVRAVDVEGDCGGHAAVTRLPKDGAYVLFIDYGPFSGDRDDFAVELPTSGRDKPFSDARFGNFECFGPSYLFRFVLEGRALQAHMGIGPDATNDRRQEAVAVLNSIAVEGP